MLFDGLYPPQEEKAILHWLGQEHLPQAEYDKAIERLKTGEPLQYVLGKAWFYGRDYHVTPAVLIPRQETEILVDEALKEIRRRKLSEPRCLDLCTGSGCIAWTMALDSPGAKVEAVDISLDALKVASSQPFDTGLPACSPRFLQGDVLRPDSLDIAGEYDVILSNPPYVRESEAALMHRNVLEHEPSLALFVSDDDPLIFYRCVAGIAARHLRRGGFGIVEVNEAFSGQVGALFSDVGLKGVRTIFDLCDKPRHVYFEK